MINDGNYITIQGWMRTDLNLSGNELIVYAIIYGFSQNKQGEFTGSAQYLADWTGCSRRHIMRILNKLVEDKFVTKTETVLNNNEKRVSYQAERGYDKMSHGVSKCHGGYDKLSQGGVTKCHRGCDKMSHNININNNNNNITRDTNNVHSCSESPEETPEETAEEFFERAWQYYPNKRGKGQVSEKSKERLMSHGWDNVKRAIDRYLEDLKKDEWRKAQNGSTFFNSGYIDYLDENYTPPMNPKLDYRKTDLDDLSGI